jgi:hypothetical protein
MEKSDPQRACVWRAHTVSLGGFPIEQVGEQSNLGRFPNAVGPEKKDAPIYFSHVAKTGGTTVSAFLRTLFEKSDFWHRGGGERWVDLLELTPERLQQFRIINGHFGGYIFKHYPLPLRYFTFVRDPLERAVSHHEHVLRDSGHYLHTLANELATFGAYLRDERTQPTVVNFQLRFIGATFDPIAICRTLSATQLAGLELERHLDTAPPPQGIEELIQTANSRLDQMCFVGLTERFDESLTLLCETFGWPMPAGVEALNVNPRSRCANDLLSKDVHLLKRLNEAEIDLYQAAKARFEREQKICI